VARVSQEMIAIHGSGTLNCFAVGVYRAVAYFAVILSAAKDPDTLNLRPASRPFLPPNFNPYYVLSISDEPSSLTEAVHRLA
jgi:hypothetical protein